VRVIHAGRYSGKPGHHPIFNFAVKQQVNRQPGEQGDLLFDQALVKG
jgi:hypothetical protein